MKTIFRTLALSAAFLSIFTACQREELEQNQDQETPTYTISFVTGEPETKTSFQVVDGENGQMAKFSWKSKDADKFTVYQILEDNYVPAESTEGTLDEQTGCMSLKASFKGISIPSGAKFQAVFNSGVKSVQSGNQVVYDQDSDVMISNIIDATDFAIQPLLLSFKRLVSFEKMTLKNLTNENGIYIRNVVIESVNGKHLVADYSFEAGDFTNYGSSLTIKDALSDIETNKAVVYFATLPVENASLKITATSVGDDMKSFVAAYEKTFAAEKFISFTRGDVKAFSVGMEPKANEIFDLTINTTSTATADEISWQSHLVSIVDRKNESTTDADNYYPGNGNKSTRFYKNSILEISPKLNVSISKIVFEATTDNYAKALASSNWTNAIAKAEISGEQYKVTVKPQDGYGVISALMGDTVGLKSITIWFGVAEPMTEHNIIIADNIENGTVESDVNKATWGTTVTLTADPAQGYEFGSWNVTTASTNQSVEVIDNQFTMPDEDVNVSAIFLTADDIKTFTIDFTKQGYKNGQVVNQLTVEPFTVSFTKGSSNEPKYYTSNNTIRFYNGGTMTVAAEDGINIKQITFTGTVKISSPTVTDKVWSSSENINEVTFTANGTNELSEIIIQYTGKPADRYNITCLKVEGGELSATAASAKEGTEIILTATPDAGYEFKSWDVTDSKGKTVDIVDNRFTMPASDVTVSGTFSKIDYTIKTESDRGSIVAKKGDATVGTAQIGDEITLSATPNEGYEFISWTVVDSEGNSVEVVDNKFTMPASNVTVSATFNSTASYTVSFSVNGNVTTKSCKETEKIEFPEVPAQDGVQFMGWATSDFSGIVSSKPELVDVNRAVMGTNDITYYAVFGVIETAVFDPNDLSATPAVSDQSLTWKHTATGVTLKLSAGKLYTGTPKTFTVNGGNNFQISSDKNYIISEIETTLSESKYKINSVSSGATLSISGTTQTVKSDNLTVIKCNATSSNQIRATKITVTALTGYSTKIITLNEVSISGSPTKTKYTVEDAFDPTGLSVTGTYSDGTTSVIAEGISWSYTPSTFTASGNQAVSVTATVKSIVSAPYEVNVTVNTITNTLTATNKSIDVNTALDVSTLFTTNSNATISYTLVENPNGGGTLSGSSFTATAAGTYTVKAIQSETSKYSAAEATATITVNDGKTVTVSSFSKLSDKLDECISYTTAKGGGTTAPAINDSQIRLYQISGSNTYGGTITLSAKEGYIIQSVTIGSSMATSVSYTLDSATTLSDQATISKNGKYTLNGITSSSVTFYCMGTSSSARLYVNYISVTYVAN